MRKRCCYPVLVTALIVATTAVAQTKPPHVSLNPDRILKGSTQTITVTLDKATPDKDAIKSVLVGGQRVSVESPGDDGKLFLPLPRLDVAGRVDVQVIGKDDKAVAIGQLTYVEAPETLPASASVSSHPYWHLFLYVLFIMALPLSCTLYDLYRSYDERKLVLNKLGPNSTTAEITTLLKDMDRGPTGLTGLTRGLLALTLVLLLAFAAFHLVIFAPTNLPDIADKLLMLLAGTLTAITGFYFGYKAVGAEAAAKTESAEQKPKPPEEPKISKVVPQTGVAGGEVTLIGESFGPSIGKGAVTVANTKAEVKNWNDKEIKIVIPPGLDEGTVNIVVTDDKGKSSGPGQFTIQKKTPPAGGKNGGGAARSHEKADRHNEHDRAELKSTH